MQLTSFSSSFGSFMDFRSLRSRAKMHAAAQHTSRTPYMPTSGHVVKNHTLSKTAERYDATRQTTCQSLLRVCLVDPPAPPRAPPQHGYRRTECDMILLKVQQTHELGLNVAEHQETSRKIRSKSKTSMRTRTAIRHGETRCMICQNGRRSSRITSGRRSFCVK